MRAGQRQRFARPVTTQPAASRGSDCGSKSKNPVPTPSPDGPQPRWVCEPKITADPVWGGKTLDYVFKIRNEGEADLQVQLKAG